MAECQYLGPTYDARYWRPSTTTSHPYCGQPTEAERSYCAQHLHMVYAKGTALRNRPKENRRRESREEFLQLLREVIEEVLLDSLS